MSSIPMLSNSLIRGKDGARMLGGVYFFYLILNITFFEFNTEWYLIALSIKLFVF